MLTGFDAPIEQVMYLDQPLREHTLLQAMGRVNRRFEKKTYGLVIDYWGVSEYLQEALEMYSEDGIVWMIHTDFKREVMVYLQAAHRAAMNFFDAVQKSGDEAEYKQACIRFLEPEDLRIAFDKRFRLFTRYMDMLLPDRDALRYGADLRWLTEIRMGARNMYSEQEDFT